MTYAFPEQRFSGDKFASSQLRYEADIEALVKTIGALSLLAYDLQRTMHLAQTQTAYDFADDIRERIEFMKTMARNRVTALEMQLAGETK